MSAFALYLIHCLKNQKKWSVGFAHYFVPQTELSLSKSTVDIVQKSLRIAIRITQILGKDGALFCMYIESRTSSCLNEDSCNKYIHIVVIY